MELKPFDNHMWDSFAGCSRWENGDLPLYATGKLDTGKEYVIVFDPTGACLLIEDDNEVNICGGRVLSLPIPSQQLAYTLAQGMGEPATIHQFHTFGFWEA